MSRNIYTDVQNSKNTKEIHIPQLVDTISDSLVICYNCKLKIAEKFINNYQENITTNETKFYCNDCTKQIQEGKGLIVVRVYLEISSVFGYYSRLNLIFLVGIILARIILESLLFERNKM